METGASSLYHLNMLRNTHLLLSNLRTRIDTASKLSILNCINTISSMGTVASSKFEMAPKDIDQNYEISKETLLLKVLEIVKTFEDRHNEDGKVANYLDPGDVPEALGGLEISRTGMTVNEASNVVDNAWKYSVKTQHKHFYNALYHGVDTYAMAGGILSEALNTNGYSHEVAPVFSAVEGELIKYFGSKFGWDYVDGLTTPGGSISNM